jgi:murein DD-endopeptidase MepM/ murein hydrolase activator NlpD
VPKVRRLLQGSNRIRGGAGVVLAGLLLLLAVGRPAGAHPVAQAPIVSPEAVTTPAPGSTPAPTAPPANAADAPGLSATPWLTYTVQPGDTLLSVALEIGVDLDDMPCIIAPDFSPDQPLVIGNVLEMPPPGTLCHVVEPGDTVETISVRYRTPVEHLQAIDWNRLPPTVTVRSPLTPGLHLRVPLAGNLSRPRWDSPAGLASAEDFLTVMLHQPVNTPPFVAYAVGGSGRARVETGQVPANWPYGSGHFAWPLFGWLTQGYRYDHRAVDIAAPAGTLVTAADRGVVIRAGWNNQGYGRFVVIDHNIDYITLYAHLDEILVQAGMVVAQGQTIGRVGSTGNSTGPHLHFEIRDFGRLTNPLELLGK